MTVIPQLADQVRDLEAYERDRERLLSEGWMPQVLDFFTERKRQRVEAAYRDLEEAWG